MVDSKDSKTAKPKGKRCKKCGFKRRGPEHDEGRHHGFGRSSFKPPVRRS